MLSLDGGWRWLWILDHVKQLINYKHTADSALVNGYDAAFASIKVSIVLSLATKKVGNSS